MTWAISPKEDVQAPEVNLKLLYLSAKGHKGPEWPPEALRMSNEKNARCHGHGISHF